MTTKIITTTGKITFIISLLFGIYIIINGHLTPGGGFQGGVIIGTGVALLLISSENPKKILAKKDLFSALESIGLIMFICLAFLGIKIAFFDNMLANPVIRGPNSGELLSGGLIPFMNIAVGLEVSCAISVIMIILLKYKKEGDAKI